MQSLLKKILDVTRLTRGGNLTEATAQIQRALAGGSTSGEAGPPKSTPADAASAMRRATVSPAEVHAAPVTRQRVEAEIVSAPSRPAATATAQPTVAREQASARKAGAHFEPSSYTAQSGTRSYKLFVPSGLDGRPVPLIVMLHGCTQDPDDFASGTRMNELAQARGFLVLYPAQAPRSNVSKCWNWYMPDDQHRGRGEPDLLAGMTRHVMQTHSIDPDRVYVAGLSAGGAMAAILGREYPDLFAAVGVHSGLPPGAAHDVSSAFAAMKGSSASAGHGMASMLSDLLQPQGAGASGPPAAPAKNAPTIVFHGDRDNTVTPSNGERVIEALFDKTAGTASGARSAWAATETASEDGGRAPERRYTRTVYRAPGAATSRAEHWLVHGAGHAWAGGSQAGTYTDPSGPDASREMLRFFDEHPRHAR